MKNFFTFKNLADNTLEITLYDEIGFWGTNAKSFHQQLKGFKGDKINVRINSPGGSVVDGYAIYNMLRAHDADVHVTVDGIAASIASVIAMAGDKITMPENALMFIHQPLVGMMGNAEDLRKVADDLDKLSDGIMNIYVARTGRDKVNLQKMMDDETLLTAKEAKTLGFCDEIIPELKVAACFKVEDHFAKAIAARITEASNNFPPAIPAGGQEKQPKNNMFKFKDQAEAEARVAALEAENSGHATAVTNAKTEAHQNALKQEKARKDGINALATKYNKDGDLNEITVKALAADTSVADFQAQVMDVINDRPAKAAIRNTGGEVVDKDSFEAKYKACKTGGDRRRLVAENRDEARKYFAKIGKPSEAE